jgi:hypothetical protein
MRNPLASMSHGWNPALFLGLAGLLLAGVLNILLDHRTIVVEEFAAGGLGARAVEAGFQGISQSMLPALAPDPSFGPTVERVVALCEAAGIDSFRYEVATRDRQAMDVETARWARENVPARRGISSSPAEAAPWHGWHQVDLKCWSDYESIEAFLNGIRAMDPPLAIRSLSVEGEGRLLRMEIALQSAAQDY